MFKLTLSLPGGALLERTLSDSLVIVGSGMESNIVVPHPSVAAAHLQFDQHEAGYFVADLAGDGTTQLNGYPIEPGTAYQLEPGTQIRFGQVEAIFAVSDAVEDDAPVFVMDEDDADAPVFVMEEEEDAPVFVMEDEEEESKLPPVPEPGSFPLPPHPPGVFAPLKAHRSPWLLASIAFTIVAVLASAVAGYLGSHISVD